MTSLARPAGPRAVTVESPVVPGSARLLLARLQKECDRHQAFSEPRLLLREAAAAIERLEADLASARAELARERAASPAR
jgi:hypothetical protein